MKWVVAGILLWSVAAQAAEIDYAAISAAGFDDVAKLLQSMSPAQQQAVLDQAAVKQQDLQQMTPTELEALRAQLRAAGDTVDMEKIDPENLDVTKSKTAAEIQSDLKIYSNKYQQNQLHNDVLRPVAGQYIGR